MTQYCLGFLFNEKLTQVALIRKTKPEWQAGKVNGIGGKIEPTESLPDAMVREFIEETGVTINDWKHYCTMAKDDTFKVYVYAAIGDLTKLKTTTEEEVIIFDINQMDLLRDELLTNVPWLIEMAMDKLKNNEFEWAMVNYY